MASDTLGYSPKPETKIEQDTPLAGWAGLESNILSGLDSISEKGKLSDAEPLILDQDSDYQIDDGDLAFMDFDQ
jgi:hypothetical protein